MWMFWIWYVFCRAAWESDETAEEHETTKCVVTVLTAALIAVVILCMCVDCD